MNASEAAFLRRKAVKERGLLFRMLRNISVIFVLLPCAIGTIMESLKRSRMEPWQRIREERADPHMIRNYIIVMVFCQILVLVGGLVFYRRNLWKLQRDLRRNLKSIEQTTIARKQFVELNNSFHFYLYSRRQLSIEVSKEDFEQFSEGDEINIEYSTYSNIYFGYF